MKSVLLLIILTICLAGCSPLGNTPVEDVLDESENKINDEVIVDNKNEISQANFFAVSSEMGIVEDMVKSEMVTVKGKEAIRGNSRTDAQIYNYIARGGEKILTPDDEGDKKWLTKEYAEDIACTKINPEYAENVFGMKKEFKQNIGNAHGSYEKNEGEQKMAKRRITIVNGTFYDEVIETYTNFVFGQI